MIGYGNKFRAQGKIYIFTSDKSQCREENRDAIP